MNGVTRAVSTWTHRYLAVVALLIAVLGGLLALRADQENRARDQRETQARIDALAREADARQTLSYDLCVQSISATRDALVKLIQDSTLDESAKVATVERITDNVSPSNCAPSSIPTTTNP